jgi:hypothetical protein
MGAAMFGYAIIRKQAKSVPAYTLHTELPDLTPFEHQPVAFDFETHGLDPLPGRIRSVGLANDAGCLAIDLEALLAPDYDQFFRWLVQQRLVAHNFMFDGAWLKTTWPEADLKFEMCTQVIFKQLAGEGWFGQRWGLKVAMTDILGWPESNEEDLYAWLKANKLKKGDMAQAPWEILGPYNALDAGATWQLYKYFCEVCFTHGWRSSVLDFHRSDFGTLIHLLIEQQLAGMPLDEAKMAATNAALELSAGHKREEFLTHLKVAPHVEYYQECVVQALEDKLEDIPEFTKTGKTAARWVKQQEKIAAAKTRQDFNVDSPKDLSWLMFDRLGLTTPIMTDKGAPSVGAKSFPHFGELGQLLKEYRAIRDRRKFLVSLDDVQRDGVLYPNVKVHGTVTGRASGGREL